MIKHLELFNYRSHEHTSFSLEPVTVFIGPVAGGKSNVFKGLTVLQSAVNRMPRDIFGVGWLDIWAQRHRGERGVDAPIGFKVQLDHLGGEFDGDGAEYTLRLNEGPQGVFIAEERLDRRRPGLGVPVQTVFYRRLRRDSYGEFGEFEATDRTIIGACRHRRDDPSEGVRFAAAVARSLSLYGHFHLDLHQLARPCRQDTRPERLGYDGRDLPGAVAAMQENAESRSTFDDIVEQMRDVLPDLKEISVAPIDPDQIGVVFDHVGFRGRLITREESDGTLFTLGLLMVIHQPQPPAILAIEEPETGLHPRRLRWVVDKLRDFAGGRISGSPVQVLISTHSPYFLDFFCETPEAVKVVTRRDGSTTIMSLPDILDRIGVSLEQLREAPLGEQWYSGLFGDLGEPQMRLPV